ncbi:hypothetical protein ACJRO7_026442 [Eucalyptus globulus]|uniref:Sugar phosphate transporter domain-containing protein n=1 Tax=Eucalyptus globulus TaxID=34317 RepID=A0ABD3JQR4_EUCGL
MLPPPLLLLHVQPLTILMTTSSSYSCSNPPLPSAMTQSHLNYFASFTTIQYIQDRTSEKFNLKVMTQVHYPKYAFLFYLFFAKSEYSDKLFVLILTFTLHQHISSSRRLITRHYLPLATSSPLGVVLLELIASKRPLDPEFGESVDMGPFFSVHLSAMFLGEVAGFWSAMASNLSNQFRNVLSKKVMVNKEESLDNITLFSIITMMSFILLFPVTFFTEGLKFTPASLQAAVHRGLNVQQVLTRSFLAALCFHAYQQVRLFAQCNIFIILVTHSVGNCVKRAVVIVSSVLFFRTPVSPINSLVLLLSLLFRLFCSHGYDFALAGVFLYSRVKRIKPKPKTA